MSREVVTHLVRQSREWTYVEAAAWRESPGGGGGKGKEREGEGREGEEKSEGGGGV